MKFLYTALVLAASIALRCLLVSCVWDWHLVPYGVPHVPGSSLYTTYVAFQLLRVVPPKDEEAKKTKQKSTYEALVQTTVFALAPPAIGIFVAWVAR